MSTLELVKHCLGEDPLLTTVGLGALNAVSYAQNGRVQP